VWFGALFATGSELHIRQNALELANFIPGKSHSDLENADMTACD
jgi:hypothetical protein